MDVCYLCKSSKKDDIQYGEFLRNENMAVHVFCLYLSSNLSQKGEDDGEFMGFLEADIKDENRRVCNLKCFYCHKPYANVGCCEVRCRHAFHLICGLENGAQNQFCNSYKSYCHRHVRKGSHVRPAKDVTCLICYDQLFGPNERFSSVNMIQAPCCRNGWFHKLCLSKFAKTSGYFFKCPLCNDAKTFRQKLPAKGIYIPNQDAAWELEPNAFAELLERPSECNASPCENKEGRNSTSASNPLIFCSTCGSTAMHKQCLTSRGSRFHCSDCTIAMEDHDSGRDSLNSPENHRNDNNNEYGDIDVCSVSDHEDVDIVQGLLPDNKPDCESISEISSSDEEITYRRSCLTLHSDSSSDYSETLKENRNPTAQRNRDNSRNDVPKASVANEQERDKTKTRNAASSTQNGVTHRRKNRILYTIEDDDVEIIHNNGVFKSKRRQRRHNDSDDDELEFIGRSRPLISQEEASSVLDDSDDSGNNENVCTQVMQNELSSLSSDEVYRIKTRRKRVLHVESDDENEFTQLQLHNKQQHRNDSVLTIMSTDDDSDEEVSSPQENIKSSEIDLTIVQVSSDEESDDDPLENFTKIVEKQKRIVDAQETRKKSVCLENSRQELPSRTIISIGDDAGKLSQTTERSKTLRFRCLPQNNCKASKELDISCIAKRTRRKSMFCDAGNTAATSCAAITTRGRRKTVCSQTTIEKGKHKQPRCYVEEKLEISCIANRTRKRTCSKPQVIDEESSSSYKSSSSSSSYKSSSSSSSYKSSSSSTSSSSSYYSTSSNNPAISNHPSRFDTKWPKLNIDFAYVKRNLNHSSKLANPKSHHPCNRHNSHANNNRRI